MDSLARLVAFMGVLTTTVGLFRPGIDQLNFCLNRTDGWHRVDAYGQVMGRLASKIVRLLKLDEAYNKAIEKVVEPFVSSKVSAGQIRSQPMLTAALHGSQQFLQQQSLGHLRRDNKRQQASPQGLRLTRDGRPVRCFRCEGNHYQSECPLAAQTGEQQQQGGRAAASTSAPVGSAIPPPPGLPPQFTPPK